MSLFPDEDILTKEVESWIGFVEVPVDNKVRMAEDIVKTVSQRT